MMRVRFRSVEDFESFVDEVLRFAEEDDVRISYNALAMTVPPWLFTQHYDAFITLARDYGVQFQHTRIGLDKR